MQYNSVLLCYQTLQLLHIFSPDSDYFPSFTNVKMLARQDISDEAPELQDVRTNARHAWPYKPGNLDNLTSSLFDVFDKCFKKNCMENDQPVPYFFVTNEGSNFEPWNSYRKDLLKEVKKHLRKCQQALVDVSDIKLYWNVDSIGLSDSPVVRPTSDAASDVDSRARNLQIE